jgi:hypothetical protein
MQRFILKNWIAGILIMAGISGGFLYWRFVGCTSGSCPITSNWHASSLMGGLLGYLTGDSINDFIKKRKNRD